MPGEDKNFGGSLVLDFRKWWRHVKTIYKNTRKNSKLLKLDKSNAVSVGVGTTAIKPYLSICLIVGLVWFAGYCGKLYNRHFFSYGGIARILGISLMNSYSS